MSDNLDKYLPEFDEDDQRERLSAFERMELIDMLLRAYREKRVLAKLLDETEAKLSRIGEIVSEPSALARTPGIPNADDLRRMSEPED